MTNGKEAAPAGTEGKSPEPDLTQFQKDFNVALEKWKANGCSVEWGGEDGKMGEKHRCGGKPNRTKLLPPVDGIVTMSVDCENGHEAVWKFEVPEAELKAELSRQIEARAKAEDGAKKDPLKASVTITLDLRTQDVSIDPFVPTPGVGLQMAAMLHVYFAQLFQRSLIAPKKSAIATPGAKGIVHPSTGKLLVQ